MMGKEYRAGISFADNVAQMAILKVGSGDVTLMYLEEFKNGMIGELWYLESLMSRHHKMLRKTSKVAIAFDHTSLGLHQFPMDASFMREEMPEHVSWELTNAVAGYNPKDFIQDTHILRAHAQEQFAEVFVMTAKRNAIGSIRTMLEKHKYKLELADMHHFGAQYALLVNYPEIRAKNVALIWVGERRIDVGLLHGGKLALYGFEEVTSPAEGVQFTQNTLVGCEVDELYLYGSGPVFDLQKALEGGVTVPVTRLNPFRRLNVARSFKDFEMSAGLEHRFAAAVGVALRKH